MSDVTIPGSCVCGAVGYQVSGPFLTLQYCHCSRCRKATGSAHAANLFVASDKLNWTGGGEHVRRYELPTAKYWCHSFCGICGSGLPWLTKTKRAWIVPAGGLDGDPGIPPARNIYFGSKAPWSVAFHELETFEAFPPKKT